MVFSLFGKGKKKKKEQPRSKYYDDYKILDTEKRIQKIKNKNWSKYLQYLINNHTKGDIKKLFYKIAAKTHPDKFASSGLAPEELSRIESIFKKAKSSYENGNWYKSRPFDKEADRAIEFVYGNI